MPHSKISWQALNAFAICLAILPPTAGDTIPAHVPAINRARLAKALYHSLQCRNLPRICQGSPSP